MDNELTITPEMEMLLSKFDECEAAIEAMIGEDAELPEFPLTHRFFPGMYCREIFMPKGSLIASRTHKTCHPFVVLEGDILVADGTGAVNRLKSGHFGVTPQGTRRVLLAKEDTRWVTFHATTLTDPDAVAEEILEPHNNPLLRHPEKAVQWKNKESRDTILRFGEQKLCLT